MGTYNYLGLTIKERKIEGSRLSTYTISTYINEEFHDLGTLYQPDLLTLKNKLTTYLKGYYSYFLATKEQDTLRIWLQKWLYLNGQNIN